ncbi:unnamed protein product [Macrosiphum euphorbiae]|uniref:Uncharacterized protein n=1 Tax=Macrosiphum euphorbiae TaxID=13131 RepID=A0AAV0YBD5_9HEMI|nr:unnamed protein product [Macrosiphum euphorbiae]
MSVEASDVDAVRALKLGALSSSPSMLSNEFRHSNASLLCSRIRSIAARRTSSDARSLIILASLCTLMRCDVTPLSVAQRSCSQVTEDFGDVVIFIFLTEGPSDEFGSDISCEAAIARRAVGSETG